MKIRVRKRGNVWWIDQMVQGKRYRASIGEGSKSWAMAQAPALLADLMAGKKRERVPREAAALCVGDLRGPWFRFCEGSRVKERTRNACWNALVLIAGGEDVRLAALRPELVECYQAERVAAEADEDLKDRRERSCVSMWNQGKSVLQSRALDFYRRKCGLPVPENVDGFAGFKLARAPAWRYVLPEKELIERTEAEAAGLEGDLRMIYRLAMNAGLRASEILALRGDWVEVHQGVPVLAVVTRGDFRPKGTERRVPVPQGLAEDVAAAGADWVIAPNLNWTERENLVGRVFADWMRSVGWDRRRFPKAAHELRKLYGSRIYSKLGPVMAQKYLGHASIETTCRYYADLDAPLQVLEER